MRYKNILFFLVLILLSNETFSYTWQWRTFCGWPGCPDIRANTITEYCNRQLDAYNAYRKSKGNSTPSVLTEHRATIWNGGGVGVCTFDNYSHQAVLTGNACPIGKFYDAATGMCIFKERPTCKAGNPINVDSGLKSQQEIDFLYSSGSRKPLTISRTYRSRVSGESRTYDNSTYGGYWSFSYTDKAVFETTQLAWSINDQYNAKIILADAEELDFVSVDNEIWENRTGSMDRLHRMQQNSLTFWELTDANNVTKTFDSNGKLKRVEDHNLGIINVVNRTVTDATGVSEYVDIALNDIAALSYRIQNGNVLDLVDHSGSKIVSYRYDGIGNLVEAKYQNGSKVYHYEDVTFIKLLTGITDELGKRYATWTYDAQGRAISSEHAGGAEKTLLSFNADGSTTVINALNKQTIYRFADIAGARRVTKVEGQPTTNCVGANQDYTYTAEGWVASKTDWKGIKTTFTYNTAGQEISRTEAFGTPEARTITTDWHPTLFVKAKVTEPEKETIYSYDTNGHLLNQSIHAF